MPRSNVVEQLATVDLFSTCTDRELTLIAQVTQPLSVDAGQHVVEQGKPGSELFLIVAGQADVVRDGRSVARLQPGQYFGELAVLDNAPRGATVTAVTSLELFVLGQREVAAVLDEWPGVSRRMLTALAARLRQAEQDAATH
jgi:CRP/FNR family transcriptional regulator, cyclic AMP receptor protein